MGKWKAVILFFMVFAIPFVLALHPSKLLYNAIGFIIFHLLYVGCQDKPKNCKVVYVLITTRYKFVKEQNMCKSFSYYCYPLRPEEEKNENNFWSEEQCEKVCKPK
jgi:hypothetical protein